MLRGSNTHTHLLEFSKEQAQHIKDTLQPGDIILTYSADYMSNVFLPGKFKHGITYIGSIEDRRKAGLSNAALTPAAISKEQAEALINNVNVTTMQGDYDVDIIEGVVMHSLDKLLETHINRLVVIRPKITEQERTDQPSTPDDYLADIQAGAPGLAALHELMGIDQSTAVSLRNQ
jgi:hypothetical protein